MPIRNYFELISFTDTDSYPPSGIRPPKIPICNSSELHLGKLTDTDTDTDP